MTVSCVLVRGAQGYAPEPLGYVDVLAVGEWVVAIGRGLTPPPWAKAEVIEAGERILCPGLVDLHVHLAGGGGEGGPRFRTPELTLTDLTRHGITTAVGVLGTDGTTRSVAELLAKARALADEGITTWIYTGAYSAATRTITGSLRDDVLLVDRVVGVGEIAVSDFRGSHPSERELARLAGEARVGGLLGGKAGVLHVHVGDGPAGLGPLFSMLEIADVPSDSVLPTHLNRRRALLEEAVRWAARGGPLDLTTGITEEDGPEAVSAAAAADWLRNQGVSLGQMTLSSDAGGSAPRFSPNGELEAVGVGSPASLWEVVWALRRQYRWPWEAALALATSNPAQRLRLPRVGRIAVGHQADWLLVDPESGRIEWVVARGRVVVRAGSPVVWGTFEKRGAGG